MASVTGDRISPTYLCTEEMAGNIETLLLSRYIGGAVERPDGFLKTVGSL